MDKVNARRVRYAVLHLATGEGGDVKQLRGTEGEFRLRVEDWRVRFTLMKEERFIVVQRVLPRGDAYKIRERGPEFVEDIVHSKGL